MTVVTQPTVQRIRKVSAEPVQQIPIEQGDWRGFGSVSGETLDQFHERMFDIDPLEAMMYEMEVALQQ